MAMVKWNLKTLAIRIEDIKLGDFKTDGSDFEDFLAAHGLDMIDRYKEALAQDDGAVTQKRR